MVIFAHFEQKNSHILKCVQFCGGIFTHCEIQFSTDVDMSGVNGSGSYGGRNKRSMEMYDI